MKRKLNPYLNAKRNKTNRSSERNPWRIAQKRKNGEKCYAEALIVSLFIEICHYRWCERMDGTHFIFQKKIIKMYYELLACNLTQSK